MIIFIEIYFANHFKEYLFYKTRGKKSMKKHIVTATQTFLIMCWQVLQEK